MRLPDDCSLVRETAARDGWFAYYGDGSTNVISALPVVLWCVVEYTPDDPVDAPGFDEGGGSAPGDPPPVQEIRPYVLTRSGQVTDAHEFSQPFLCILGPDVDHIDTLRRVLRQLYPTKNWDRTSPSMN